MPDDETDAAEYARAELFTQLYLRSGWNRYLPIGAVELFSQFVIYGKQTLGQLNGHLTSGRSNGLSGNAWDALKVWTEEDRQRLIDEGEEDVESVEELNATEQRDHASRVARFERLADAIEVPHVNTMFDVLTFAIACHVVTATFEDGDTWLEMNPQAPLPEEILPLSDEEQTREDDLRWRDINEPIAQAIIGLFRPDDEVRPEAKKTSLERLARELDVPVDDARAGLACLLKDPDFTANRDPETLREHEVFEIRVDWEVFARTRFSLRFAEPGEDDEQGE
jgi:hypothetical protein